MVKLKKYDLQGSEIAEEQFDDELIPVKAKSQSIKDYIVAIRANARQWSANTKGRSDINHSNAKPHAQKGSGKARQGTIKATQYRGGATVFGPKPKSNQHVRINKKEKKAAISYLLGQKIAQGQIAILKLDLIDKPNTKQVASLLNKMGLKGKKILFLSDQEKDKSKERSALYLSMRNIPNTNFMLINTVSGYDLMKNHQLVVTEAAFQHVTQKIKGA